MTKRRSKSRREIKIRKDEKDKGEEKQQKGQAG
jgi:hypothetical protein